MPFAWYAGPAIQAITLVQPRACIRELKGRKHTSFHELPLSQLCRKALGAELQVGKQMPYAGARIFLAVLRTPAQIGEQA